MSPSRRAAACLKWSLFGWKHVDTRGGADRRRSGTRIAAEWECPVRGQACGPSRKPHTKSKTRKWGAGSVTTCIARASCPQRHTVARDDHVGKVAIRFILATKGEGGSQLRFLSISSLLDDNGGLRRGIRHGPSKRPMLALIHNREAVHGADAVSLLC